LKFPHPRSWSLDHVIPVKDNPALMLNQSNWRSSHLDCNNHRQTGEPPIEMGEPSEAWIWFTFGDIREFLVMESAEQWRRVAGRENFYEVSSLGRVRIGHGYS
jgi:hypothetical protein